VDQIALVVALGLSFVLNMGLVLAIVAVVRHNRAIAADAMAKAQDAMDAILAATNLPAADFHHSLRERSMKKHDEIPVERERTVLN
jgi:hypothetical protein